MVIYLTINRLKYSNFSRPPQKFKFSPIEYINFTGKTLIQSYISLGSKLSFKKMLIRDDEHIANRAPLNYNDEIRSVLHNSV